MRRHVAGHQLETFGQDNAVALDAQATTEDNGVALAVVALRIPIRLDDENTALAIRRNGARELHPNVAAGGICGSHQWILASFHAGDDVETQRLAGHGVVDSFVACGAAFANRIEIQFRAGSRGSHFIMYFEAGGFRREQFVARVFVGFRLLRGDRTGNGGGLLSVQGCAAEKQSDSGNRGLFGHAGSLHS